MVKTIMLRIRVEPEFKQLLQNAITEGKAKTMSQLIRKAVYQFLGKLKLDELSLEKDAEYIVFEHIKNCPHCRKEAWEIFVSCIVSKAVEMIPSDMFPQEIRERIRKKLEEEINEINERPEEQIA